MLRTTYIIRNALQHNGQCRRLVPWKLPSQRYKKDIASLIDLKGKEKKGRKIE